MAKFGPSPPFLRTFPAEGLDGVQRRQRGSEHTTFEGHIELVAPPDEEGPGARRAPR